MWKHAVCCPQSPPWQVACSVTCPVPAPFPSLSPKHPLLLVPGLPSLLDDSRIKILVSGPASGGTQAKLLPFAKREQSSVSEHRDAHRPHEKSQFMWQVGNRTDWRG